MSDLTPCPRILTRCPACNSSALTISDGHLLCTWIDCPNPIAIHNAPAELAALRAERDALQAWKESAISVTPPLQEIAKALDVPLGASIHDKILPGVLALRDRAERAESDAAAMRAVSGELLGVLEAHEVDTLDCDRRGQKFCTCLERAIAKLNRTAALTPEASK